MIPRLGIQRMHLDAAGKDGPEVPMQAALEPSAPAVHCSLRNPQEGAGPPAAWQQHSSYACQGGAAAHTADSGSSMEEAATGTVPQLQLRAHRSPSCEPRPAAAVRHPELPGGSSSVPGEDSQGSDSQSDDAHDEDDDDDVAYGEPPSKKSSQKRRNKPPAPKAPPPGGILLLGPCNHCGVTFSPQWRKGTPDKPVLCNACGIRLRRHKSLDTTPASLAAAAAAAAAAPPPASHKRRSTDGGSKARGHHVVTKVSRPMGRPPTAGGGQSHSTAPRSHATPAVVYSAPQAHHRAGDSEEDGGMMGADGGRGERTRRKVVTWNRLTHERTTASPSPGAGGGVSPGAAAPPSSAAGQPNKLSASRHVLQQLEMQHSSQAALAGWGSSGTGLAAKQGGSSGARRVTHRSGPGGGAAAAAAGTKAGAGAAWQSWGQGMAAGAAAKHYSQGPPAAAAAGGGLSGHKRPSSAVGGMGGAAGGQQRQVRHPSQRSHGSGASSGRYQQHQQQQQLAGGALGSAGGAGGSRSSKGMWGLGLMNYGSHSNLLLPLDSPSRTLASSPLPGAGGHGPLGEDEDMCSLLQEWTQGGSLDDLTVLVTPGDEGLLPPEEAPVGHAAALHSYAAGFSSHGNRGQAAAAAAMAVAAAAAGGVHSGEHQQAVGLLDHVLRQPMASAAGGLSSTAVALSGSKAGYSGSNGSLLNSSWTSPSKALQAYNSSTLDARAIPWGGAGAVGGGSSSSTSHGADPAAPHSSGMAAAAGGAPRSSWLQKGIPLSSSATCIAALAEAAAGGLDPLGAPPSLPSQPLSLDLLDQGAWSGAPISPELMGSDALALEVFGQMGMLQAAPVVGNFPNLAASPDPLKALAIALHQEQQAGKQAAAAAAGLPSHALELQWGAEAGGEAGGSTGSNKPGGSSSASEQQGSPTAHGSSAAAAAGGKVEGPGAAAAAVAGGSSDKLSSPGATEGRQVARQLPMGDGGVPEGSFGRDAPVGVLSAAAHTLQQLLKEEGRLDSLPQHSHPQQQQLGPGGGDSWVDEWNLYDSAPAAATLA